MGTKYNIEDNEIDLEVVICPKGFNRLMLLTACELIEGAKREVRKYGFGYVIHKQI
jgi:hypothetical protein